MEPGSGSNQAWEPGEDFEPLKIGRPEDSLLRVQENLRDIIWRPVDGDGALDCDLHRGFFLGDRFQWQPNRLGPSPSLRFSQSPLT